MTDVPSATCPAESHGDLTHASCLAGKQADRAVYVDRAVPACVRDTAPSGGFGTEWPGKAGNAAGPSTARNGRAELNSEGAEVADVDVSTADPGHRDLANENARLRAQLADAKAEIADLQARRDAALGSLGGGSLSGA